MLQDILGMVTQITSKEVSNNDNVSNDNMGAIAQMAFSAISGAMKNNASTGNMSGITDLLSGSGSNSGNNPLVNGIQQSVVNSISEKLGINPSVANGLASASIPQVMNALSNKVSDPNEKGFSVESVLGAFTSNNDDDKQGGRLMDIIGGFLK